MRVLSWNLRDLQGDPLAVHRAVRRLQPDVACFQEAPRRPGARLRLWLLERGTGLRYVAGGRRGGGTAIFVSDRVTVSWAVSVRLPVPGRFTRTRGTCVVEAVLPEVGPLVLASVHLPLRPDLRLEHVRRVRGLVASRGRTPVIAGDLNEPVGSAAWQAWHPLVVDPCPEAPPTFPCRVGPGARRQRIDAVLIGPGLRAVRYGDGGCDPDDLRLASDHLPVVADVVSDMAG